MMLKKYLPAGVLALLCIYLLVHMFAKLGPAIAYHKGRAEQALVQVEVAEEKVKEVEREMDKVVEESNKEIKKLREARVERKETIARIDEAIAETPVPPGAEPVVALYVEKIGELQADIKDLEATIVEKDEIIRARDNTILAYVEQALAQREAIKRFEKRCKVAERAVKRQKIWTYVGKGATLYFGGKAVYNAIRGRS